MSAHDGHPPLVTPGQDAGLVLFAMPKAFAGHIGTIQRNAVESWTRLAPRPRILLLGDDAGTAEIAAALGCDHIPEVPRNAAGTPLVSGLFEAAARYAPNDVLAYVNADIILFDNFMSAVAAARNRFDAFLMIGRRHDLTWDRSIDFDQPDWRGDLLRELAATGILHAECGLDYFVHTPGLWGDIPPFALGRTAWDNWLVSAPLARGNVVLNASAVVTAIHQNHDYKHIPQGVHAAYFGEEASANRAMAEATGISCTGTCCDAAYAFAPDGRIVPQVGAKPQFESEAFKTQRQQWLEAGIERCLRAQKPRLALMHLEELAFHSPDDPAIAARLEAMRRQVAETAA